MVRTLLVSCNIADDPYPVYPLGMSLVAAFARQKGHEVFEIDLRANEDPIKFLEDAISELLPKAIGLSLRNVDNTDSTNPRLYIEFYKTISKKIRSVSNANLIIGGAAFSLFPNEMMDYLDADYGIVGEGEEAFAELLNCISDSIQPANKIISRDVEINNSTAFLSRNKKIAESYSNQTGMLNIQTKRGCPHKCAYCSYPILEGSCYRFRDASRVADEIEMLINEYGISHYVLTDSVFNDKEKRYLDIAEELVRRGIKTPYVSFMKPDKFTLDEARLLKKSGLSAVE